MKPTTIFVLVGGLFIFLFSSLVYAGVPQMINYQGKITTPQGALVDTTIAMVFTIYDAPTDGGVLWTETQATVVVEKGIFSVILGTTVPIDDSVFDGNVRYLGVKVGADPEMSPRKAMVSVAYAYRAGTADGGGGWVDDGTVVRLETQTDSVGIGTTTPNYRLHLEGSSTAPSPLIYVDQTGTGRGFWVNTVGGACAMVTEAGNHGLRVISAGGDGIHVMQADGWAGYFDGTGYFSDTVGIGTSSPSEKLDVSGTVKMTGFKMPTGAGTGKVLTSDASGVGIWQAAAGGGDNDWTFRITDTADTTLITGGQWGIARSGNLLYGNADSTHVNLGVACTTGASGQNYKYSSVGGGLYNTASQQGAAVAGGQNNAASADYTTVAGGYRNSASGSRATVGGGYANKATATYATAGGGTGNIASGSSATIAGGYRSTASGSYAAVPGGEANIVAGDYSLASGYRVEITSTADNTFAFGRRFTTSTPNAVIFHNSDNPIKVGIGTTAPDEELHVVGNIKMVDGNQAAGKVLTSDANGVGTWQAAAGGGGWADDGNAVRLETVTDSVGIGTATPSEKLEVSGNIKASGTITSGSSITIDGATDKITATSGIIDFDNENLQTTGNADVGGFKMATGAATGKVLTSDASGVGTWQAAAGGDIDWTFQITDTADTTLMTGGQWGIARAGNVLYGSADSTHVNLGVASTTGYSGANYKYCTVGGGFDNIASAVNSTVGGGEGNTASQLYATVGGGLNNTASQSCATVGGGLRNTASGVRSTVGGGEDDSATADFSTVGGGRRNTASAYGATVAGGNRNTASGYEATVGGGLWNTASGYQATVGGGFRNTASGMYATVPGGHADTAAGVWSLAAGYKVRIAADGSYTFAFGRDFTTSTANAVVFSHPSAATRMGINLTNPTYAITLPNNANNSGRGMANAWNTYSSIRWKENISPIDDALDKVLALRGVYFDWKQDQTHDIGLIAEEVGKVIPELVSYEENGVDAEGLNYAKLTALLVEAIKEQQKTAKEQQKEIESLKAKINALETNNR